MRKSTSSRGVTRGFTSGFTLVELLVVIGIIAVLISIILPALGRARESANTIKCASNLRSIGQAMHLYVSDNKSTFPAAYLYEGHKLANGQQSPDKADNGYIHWSSYLYKRTGKGLDTKVFKGRFGWDAFECPSLENGGLPPTNTFAENLDAGQSNDNGPAVIDQQAPRCAFTVNEAICPKNKFVRNFQGAARAYQFVRAGQIRKSAETILATEWSPDWRIVSDDGRANPGEKACKSHRPLHGFKGISGELNMESIAPAMGGRPALTRATVADLAPNPVGTDSNFASSTRLDWVGRNHGKKKLDSKGYDNRRSNFLYVDGHVETKQVKETIGPRFEWGERFYSLNPNNDFVAQ